MKYVHLKHIYEFSEQNKICGLYAIAATTTIAHGENQSNLQFKEDQMRNHLCKCSEKLLCFYKHISHIVTTYVQ